MLLVRVLGAQRVDPHIRQVLHLGRQRFNQILRRLADQCLATTGTALLLEFLQALVGRGFRTGVAERNPRALELPDFRITIVLQCFGSSGRTRRSGICIGRSGRHSIATNVVRCCFQGRSRRAVEYLAVRVET